MAPRYPLNREDREQSLRRCITAPISSSTAGLPSQDRDFVRDLAEQAQEMVDDFIEDRIVTYVADVIDEEPIQ